MLRRPITRAAAPPIVVLLLLVGATSAAAQAPSAPSAEIIGGAAAPAGTWDFAAYVVEHDSGGYGTCTGSVISPNVVLTAAHCVLDGKTNTQLDPSAFTITTGSLDMSDGGARQVSAVTSVSVGPGFSLRSLLPDEAVLVLATPTTAPAVSLATSADVALYTPGAPVVLAGWGLEHVNDKDVPSVLQATNTNLQSDRACRESAGGAFITYSPGWMLCTAGGGVACKGDSGGPILEATTPSPASLADWRLIGTTSWGDYRCSYLSVAASELPLNGWIAQQVAVAGGSGSATPAAAVATLPTALSMEQAIPVVPVPIKLELHVAGHGNRWFRLRLLANPRTPIDELHVKLQYYTGYGFKAFASLTLVSGKPVVREFSGNLGHYDVRAVSSAGPGYTAGKSGKAIFTLS
ncbi:MAG: serine protease [Gaiellales bacterium]